MVRRLPTGLSRVVQKPSPSENGGSNPTYQGMIRLGLIYISAILLMAGGCGRRSTESNLGRAAVPSPVVSHVQPVREFHFASPFDPDANHELGKAIDEGHQPWRLDPVMTAQFMLLSHSDDPTLPDSTRVELNALSDRFPKALMNNDYGEMVARWETEHLTTEVRIASVKTPAIDRLRQATDLYLRVKSNG